MKRRPYHFLLQFLIVSSLLSGCGSGGSDVARESTVEAISAAVRATGTAAAAANVNPNAAIETAQADATAFSQSIEATLGVQANLSAEDQAATATAIAPILADLPRYGVDPAAGRMGWIHPPATLEVEGFMQFDYINNFIATLASDFVVSADITWDAIGATSGCGFVLRSDGNENALNQYLTIMTRVASGHILFATMAEGEVVTGQDIYAQGFDPGFDWQNQSTNRLTVVGRGDRFWIYTNGNLIGEIDPSAPPLQPNLPPEPERPVDTSDARAMANYLQQQAEYQSVVEQIEADFRARRRALANADTTFERGFIALVALSQSGRKTTCQFDNTWLWLIE
ncbi:MAG TPA: hypothetical protein VFO91_03705 [Anaerolineales bacterium]|nr:hypothetical protein [Anaerolineales bacterium]